MSLDQFTKFVSGVVTKCGFLIGTEVALLHSMCLLVDVANITNQLVNSVIYKIVQVTCTGFASYVVCSLQASDRNNFCRDRARHLRLISL